MLKVGGCSYSRAANETARRSYPLTRRRVDLESCLHLGIILSQRISLAMPFSERNL